jgi:cytochrome c-type biogenesis protein CcmE
VRVSNQRGIKLLLGLAIAFLAIALTIALVRNDALQKRVVRAERIADERAEAIGQMLRQCGIAASVTLEKLSDTKEAAADDDATEENNPIDGGIEVHPVEKW